MQLTYASNVLSRWTRYLTGKMKKLDGKHRGAANTMLNVFITKYNISPNSVF